MKKIISITFIHLFLIITVFSKTDTSYYASGQIKKIKNYNSDGREHGTIYGFYKSGKKASETNFKNGEWHGELKSWYENGQLKQIEPCFNGKGHGWHIYWDSLGFPTDSILAENGQKKERFLFYQNSRKVRIHEYYVWLDGKQLVALQDVYNKEGKIVSQVRNGIGLSHKIYQTGDFVGTEVFKGGKSSVRDFISKDSGDQRLKRKPIPKNKLLPWNVEKYGKIKSP